MNAIKTTRQIESSIAHFVRRGAMLIALLLAFVSGVRAEVEYVIYYDVITNNSTVRHFISISEDGTSVEDATTFSDRCVWVANAELATAQGEWGVNLTGGDANTANTANRKSLQSKKHEEKYLSGPSSGYESSSQNGNPVNLSLRTKTEHVVYWLIDKDDSSLPVFYGYYYNHYVYYDGAWKFSSGVDVSNKPERAKITKVSDLPPTPVKFSWEVVDDRPYLSMYSDSRCKIYYTLDGSEPTTSSNEYTAPISLDWNTPIKAIAVLDNQVSDINNLVLHRAEEEVTINDHEDHTWTYYSGVDDTYNTNYKGRLYCPNPRDVKITYDGNGGAVSINNGENQTSFVYIKTLECKEETVNNVITNTYPYTVISNPFSKRPSGKGFGGWKIISGGDYIDGYDNGDILPLDQEIKFVNLPYDEINCISAEIELQATWVDINNIIYLTNITDSYTYTTSGGTCETNFLVLKCEPTSITLNSPCTIMMVEPDGSVDYRGLYTFTGSIVPSSTGTTKIEFAHWKPAAAIDAQGKNYTIGRGMIMDGSTKQDLYGTGGTTAVNQILKVESGVFKQFIHYNSSLSKANNNHKQWVTFGCDYDRAKSDNTKLTFTNRMFIAENKNLKTTSDQEICRVYGLSGKFMTSHSVGKAIYQDSYYMAVVSKNNYGLRYLEILGGEWVNIAGGRDGNTTEELKIKPAFTFRMKGGSVKGCVFGAAEYVSAGGARTFVITGGTIKGWVAGGANGTEETLGDLTGTSYVYIGGNAIIGSKPNGSEGSSTVINRAVGGNVFGAGCGFDANSSSGQVTLGTNVVIADNAYVERGVYGGGSYGYTEATSNIYITGGIIGGNAGGVNGTSYDSSINGGVYGGACQNKGGNVNIYMTGGTVNGGLYGGSNASGTLSGNVTMKITGGNVGESTQKTASIYGAGYGSATTVAGNTNITMTGGTINGSVFGGGNQGVVNSNTSVTITGGTVTGNVYGGGNEAAVSGTTKVVIGSDGL